MGHSLGGIQGLAAADADHRVAVAQMGTMAVDLLHGALAAEFHQFVGDPIVLKGGDNVVVVEPVDDRVDDQMGALGAQSRVFSSQLSHGALLLNIGAGRAQNLAHTYTFLIADPAFGTRSLVTSLLARLKVTLVTLHGEMGVPRRATGQL